MKPRLQLLFFFVLLSAVTKAQTARDYALELYSEYNGTNLTIGWPKDSSAQRYYIYSKERDAFTWNLHDSSLGGSDSIYTDFSYYQGSKRDYWVQKKKAGLLAHGYMYVGHNINHVSSPGILLLVIDSNYLAPLQSEIQRLQSDLENENWEVRTFVCQRSDSVQRIRNWVVSQWNSDSLNIGSLLLLGRIPVPYSGNFNPDAHPDHQGAWPADVYYVTPSLTWTDNTVNTTSGSRTENHNVPGDGKFDQDYIWPELARIPMGRVDLYNMPAFGNDTALMKQYLDRNHAFRTGKIEAENRGLIDDNFGAFGGEAFASNGWRVFAPMFDSAVYALDYFSSMRDSSFLFSYGCGGGSYTSAAGIGNSANFASDSLLNPFTMLFGSYFGDWDCANNFLRAPLASKGWTLTNAWAGRPMWMFQHAALNEPIGLASIQAQNAYPTYQAGYSGTYAHIALMGDPSLRIYTLAPLDSVKSDYACGSVHPTIRWYAHSAETDSVEIWVKNGSSWHQYNSYKASNDSFVLNKPAGSYELRAYAYYWERNPSGFFKVRSHPLEFTTEIKSPVDVQLAVWKDTLCLGDTVFFLDNTAGHFTNREWMVAGQSLGSDSSSFFVPGQTGRNWLKLRLTDSVGCVYTDSLYFDVFDVELVAITIHGANPGPLCGMTNNTIFLQATGTSHTNYEILWDDGGATFGVIVGGSAVEAYQYAFAGNYLVKITLSDSNGCSDWDTARAIINPSPATPVIDPSVGTTGQAMKDFRSDYYPNYDYHWAVDSCTLTAGDSVHKVTVDCPPSNDINYKVSLVVENEYGCLSDSGFAYMQYTVGMEEMSDASFKVYPNPAYDKVTISGDRPFERVQLYDATGKLILESNGNGSSSLDLPLNGMPEGIYVLRVESGGNWTVTKLVVVR